MTKLIRSLDEDLREACAIGDESKVQDLIRQGAKINSANKVNGWTALHWAAYRGHRSIVMALLHRGADPAVKNNKGETVMDLLSSYSLNLLDGNEVEDAAQYPLPADKEVISTLPIVPNYIRNPKFPYTGSDPVVQPPPGSTHGPPQRHPQPQLAPLARTPTPTSQALQPQSMYPSKVERLYNSSVPPQQTPSVPYIPPPPNRSQGQRPPNFIVPNSGQVIYYPDNMIRTPYAAQQGAVVSGPMINVVPITSTAQQGVAVTGPVIDRNPVTSGVPTVILPPARQLLPHPGVQLPAAQPAQPIIRLTQPASTPQQVTPVASPQPGSSTWSYKPKKIAQAAVQSPAQAAVQSPGSSSDGSQMKSPPPPAAVIIEEDATIKVRLQGTDDFFEVDLSAIGTTYKSLCNCFADELDIADPGSIRKIRKLPNVLVRKDKDLTRIKSGNEFEVEVGEATIVSLE